MDYRLTGVAFRIHSEKEPHKYVNCSMLSYLDGRDKQTRDSCEVLGYWGDLCLGPFAVWGITSKTIYFEYFKLSIYLYTSIVTLKYAYKQYSNI